jgi:hypothetical protein
MPVIGIEKCIKPALEFWRADRRIQHSCVTLSVCLEREHE